MEKLFARISEHNPDMRQMIFSQTTAKMFLETHLGAREVAAFEACAVPAMQADYFRYCAVHVLGGFYCDADCICTGSLLPLLEADGILVESMRLPETLNNNLFAFKDPGHLFPKLAMDIATAAIENRLSERVSAVTGPFIFNLLWRGFKRGSFDAWLQEAKGTSGLVGEEKGVARQVKAIRLAVGDYTRLAGAFDGVRVLAWADLLDVITPGSNQLAYKETRNHFPNWEGSIYR
ncbi:MAG TPA: glycosyltransferase [Solirubrobacterales bacterium]|nr:glycosyltransferase [Solirubrobacterales bacterium]